MSWADYLLVSWHVSTRPAAIDFKAEPKPKWLGLQIERYQPIDDTHAIVEFVARYSLNGRAHRLHKTSNFIKENDRWFYVDDVFV